MTATVTIRPKTGASPGSMGPSLTGVDLESADNSTNTLANRQTNPITVPTVSTSNFSYEKWLLARVDVAPANFVSNFKVWAAGSAVATGVTLAGEGAVTSYTTPVNTSRATAGTLPTTSGAALAWDTASYSSIGEVTKHAVLQLCVGSTASPGNIPQTTVSYSYDET